MKEQLRNTRYFSKRLIIAGIFCVFVGSTFAQEGASVMVYSRLANFLLEVHILSHLVLLVLYLKCWMGIKLRITISYQFRLLWKEILKHWMMW